MIFAIEVRKSYTMFTCNSSAIGENMIDQLQHNAYNARQYSIGEVLDFSGSHAYAAIVVEGKGGLSVVGVEPQNDKIRVVSSGHRMYAAQHGLVKL